MIDFKVRRIREIMSAEPGNPFEVEGVLNPAAVRGQDGELYLFPRLVAKGNFSRVGIARVNFDSDGEPSGVERLGIALEPEEQYELRGEGQGGCEDPRVTYIEDLKHYVMTYTALSPRGPRLALATSTDLSRWKRHGLISFEPHGDLEFDGIDNKDGSIFPVSVPDPNGIPSVGLLHRPLFPGTRPEEKVAQGSEDDKDVHLESIWISYRNITPEADDLAHFTSHHRLASPVAPWEKLKIGGGPPPMLTPDGWVLVYHGVSVSSEDSGRPGQMCYSAGLMFLSTEKPSEIMYRTPKPLLTPNLPHEREGVVANVVFPTGLDRRTDLGKPNRFDMYYGMADDRIGVASFEIPESLPANTITNDRLTAVTFPNR